MSQAASKRHANTPRNRSGRPWPGRSGAAEIRQPLRHARKRQLQLHPILKMLQGGDRRSIGRSNEVVALVLERPDLFDTLITGMCLDDPLVRMRCADAAEKITAAQPQYLLAHKRTLIEDLSRTEQSEVRWHVAAMLARLPLSAREQARVIGILLAYTNDRSSIVKTLAMQALADLALRDETLQTMVRRHIAELVVIGTPAMRARGRRLLAELKPGRTKTKKSVAEFRHARDGDPPIAHRPCAGASKAILRRRG